MSIDSEKITVERRSGRGRYSYKFEDGSEADLTFTEQGPGMVAITHTGTPPQHRGQGVAAAMVARAVKDFRATGVKVIPACGFAAGEFRQHPDWSDVLVRR